MKDPEKMSLEELELLLEIRKLELKNSLMEVQSQLQLGYRILRALKKSGILSLDLKSFHQPPPNKKPPKSKSTPPSPSSHKPKTKRPKES